MQQPLTTSETQLEQISDGNAFTKKVVRGSWLAYFAAALFQVIFFQDLTNIAVIIFIGIGWYFFTALFLRQYLLRNYSFSTFLIFGFCATQILFPLLFTSIEFKPVIYNLEYPERVFLHSLAALLVLTLSHIVYRFLTRFSYNKSFSLMEKVGFYIPPSDTQLWIMGLIGIASTYYIYFVVPDVGRSVTGSASDKLIQGLLPFTYAPYFILCGELYQRKSSKTGANLLPLIGFTLVLFALSVGRSSTGAFMFGFTSLAFSYLLGSLIGVFTPKFFTFRNLILGSFGVWLLVGPLADLRTAMVIVRGDRTEIPAETLLLRTIEAYGDKEAIQERRDAEIGEALLDPDWDERYLDNVFTARFSNVKFNDLSLERAEWLGEYDPDMLDFAYSYFLGALPDPIIKFFNFDVDKEITYGLSTGDFLYLDAGGYGTPEGFRVGHFAGVGLATFGWWYLAILGFGMIPIFFLFDKFQQKKRTRDFGTGDQTIQLKFSFCGMLSLNAIFQYLPNESVTQIGTFIIRGWIQMVFLYLLIFHLTRLFSLHGFKRLRWSSATN